MRDIVCDVHIGGVNEITSHNFFKKDQVLLGDIYDLKNCLRKDNHKLKVDAAHLSLIFGDRYVRGNHDYVVSDNDYFIENGVVYAHGWLEMWDVAKIVEWQHKAFEGTGKIGCVLANLIDFGRSLQKKPPESFFVKAFLKLKNSQCHTYVCGHKHYKEKIERKHEGMRVVVLPRGFSLGKDI